MSVFLFIFVLFIIVSQQTFVVSNSKSNREIPVFHSPSFEFGFREKSKNVDNILIVIFLYALMNYCSVLKGRRDILHTNGKYLFQHTKFDEELSNPKLMKNSFLPLEVSKGKLPLFSWTSSSSALVYPVHLEFYFNDLRSNNTDNLMKYEWARYLSFTKFPVESPAMPSKLASLGFYYVGPYDQVQCFSCQLVYGDWKLDDDPLEIHKRFSPECTFLLENGSLNVPIHDGRINNVDTKLVRADNDGNKGAQGGCTENQVSNVDSQTFNNNCKHPQYRELSVRLSSYVHWPCGDIQSPEDLAKAGFFYAGFSDCVRCFFCGLGLRNWEYGDGAWSEHARWSANCLYLKQNKSLEFIQKYKEHPDNAASGAACAGSKSDPQIRVKEEYKGKKLLEDQTQTHAGNSNDVTKDNAQTEQFTKQLVEMGFEQSIVATAVSNVEKTSEKKLNLSQLLDTVLSMETSHQPEPNNNNSNLYPSPNKTKAQEDIQRKTHVGKVDSSQKHSITGFDHALSIDGVQSENRKLKNQLLCKICMDKNSCVVLLPCGHMISCESCSSALRKCAICRKKVRERVRIHTS